MRNIVENLVQKKGYSKLLPIQEMFIEWWEKEERKTNLVVSAPTTSGKTLIAEAMIKYYSESESTKENLIIVYISPLLALLNEKQKEFTEIFEDILIKTTLEESETKGKVLYLFTPEMFFDCIKNDPTFLSYLRFVIIDEIHLISDKKRGMILDFLITFLKLALRDSVFLCMSATISYRNELKDWLNADCIHDNRRAIELEREVKIVNIQRKGDDIVQLILEEQKNENSILVFRGTKKWVHSTVMKLSKKYSTEKSEAISREMPDYGRKTNADERIETYLKLGIGLHHADVRKELKSTIEELFRKQLISVIISTTTLGMGINLPADTVIISDLSLGRDPLTLMNYYQLAGRAGRLGYRREGKAYLLVTKTNDKSEWEQKISLPFESDEPISISSLITRSMRSIEEEMDCNPEFELYLLRVISTHFFTDWEQIIEHHKHSFSQLYQEKKTKSRIKLKKTNIYPGLHKIIRDVKNFDSYIRKFGQLFEEKNIVLNEDTLELTTIGEECLKNSVSPILLIYLIEWIIQTDIKKLSLYEVIIRTILLFGDLYVSPDPDNRGSYSTATIKGFHRVGIDVFDYLSADHRRRSHVTTDLTLAAMIFSSFYYPNFEEVCNAFGVMCPSFMNAKYRLTRILESISSILDSFYSKNKKAKFLENYALQTYYCVSEDKIELVKFSGIGKERAELIMEKYSQIEGLDLNEEESVEEIASIKGISKRMATDALSILLQKASLHIDRGTQTFQIVLNEVLELLKNKESNLLEYKVEFNINDTNHKRKLAQTVCAFTNNKGGYFVFGINNDREIVGIEEEKYKIEELDNVLADRLQLKFDNYSHYFGDYNNKKLLILEVYVNKYKEPFYCDKIIYYRRKGRNEKVTYEEYLNLKKFQQ